MAELIKKTFKFLLPSFGLMNSQLELQELERAIG